MLKLPRSFYTREDVLEITEELLGKFLVTKISGKITSGMITEAEAYGGMIDSASHAFKGRRTTRTEIMYSIGGTAYVYISYGIHHLFNVVTNEKDIPHAILIRAVEPSEGIDLMLKRRKKKEPDHTLSAGPGSMSVAMGIKVSDTGTDLLGEKIWIEDRGITIPKNKILRTILIGVENAGKDAHLNYRYIIADNPWITRSSFNKMKNG
jgi:DNA-3-methyladenine glycosylase